jgi:hypothetical protein
MSKILFKKALKGRLEEEFSRLDLGLKAVILAAHGYMQHHYGKGLTLVTLLRTDAEQDATYKDYETYQKAPWKSYHQLGLAADIRYAPFDFDEWASCVVFLENAFQLLGFDAFIHTPNDTLWPPHVHVEVHKHTEKE